ncbi:hypothetical protein [Pyrobaculum neutrophilum]|uniref:Uncharacterized protein n=1 Tax=Pyrobaculum neutrophilum (strain DSM 2338 / JCM 9278 / NBRC 100436 / V24Sta) TaxID=444157 RepID=B1YBC6_PYRNV|nr:hypothetical protein [Pyrobaculum neutrophilum]ACB39257.1 conserved hypothetical protein [Pyrobaculum neutrophilum V24Sta]
MQRWAYLLAAALAAVPFAAWLISVIQWDSPPLEYRPTVSREDGRINIGITPVYQRYVDKPGGPYIVVILDGPTPTSVQVWAKGPNVGKIQLYDVEVSGNVVRIPLRGQFKRVLDDWRNATDVEVPIEIDLWYADAWGFAVAHVAPGHVAKLTRGEWQIKTKPRIVEWPKTEPPPPSRAEAGKSFQRPQPLDVDCRYEWRYNTTIFDTERDYGGRIPLILFINSNPYSGAAGLSSTITLIDRVWTAFGVVLGWEVGGVGITGPQWEVIQWDVKYNSTSIGIGPLMLYPEEKALGGTYGRLIIAKYDEYQVCYDRGVKVGESKTGRVKFQSDVLYIRGGSWISTDVPAEVITAVYNNFTDVVSAAAYPGQQLDLSVQLAGYYSSSCSGEASVGLPVGVIAKALLRARVHPALILLPVSVSADFKQFQGVELKAQYANLGRFNNRGYDVAEYVVVKGAKTPVYVGSCRVNLPFLIVDSR